MRTSVLMAIAKAVSSAYVPIAGVMVPESMYQALLAESRKLRRES